MSNELQIKLHFPLQQEWDWRVRLWAQNPFIVYITYQSKTKKQKKTKNHLVKKKQLSKPNKSIIKKKIVPIQQMAHLPLVRIR